MIGRSPISIKTWTLPHSPHATRFLVAASTLDHGYEFPAASGRCPLIVECGHRGHESREGGLKRDTGQGHFRFRQRYPRDDKSAFPSGPP